MTLLLKNEAHHRLIHYRLATWSTYPNFRHPKKKEKKERGEFITPPRPTGRRGRNKTIRAWKVAGVLHCWEIHRSPGVIVFNMAAKLVLRSCCFGRNMRVKSNSVRLFSKGASYFAAQRNIRSICGFLESKRKLFQDNRARFAPVQSGKIIIL